MLVYNKDDGQLFLPLKKKNFFWFFFKFDGNLVSRWHLHSPPCGKEKSTGHYFKLLD